jgi:hypothetical protein
MSCRRAPPQRQGWRCSAQDGVVTTGMAAQDQWRRRTPASLVRRHGMALGERGTGARPPFEGSVVLFRGCGTPAVQEWVTQCQGTDTGLAAQCRTVAGMASPKGLAEQRRDMTPRRVRGTACACRCQSIKCPGRGSRYGGGVPAGVSSEADLTRGGVHPPSEAEPHVRGRLALERGGPRPRGRPALERGGASPEGATGPRARRGFVSTVLCPSSEAEFRPRVAGPLGPPGP